MTDTWPPDAAADRWLDHIDERYSLLAAQFLIARSRDELAPEMRSLPIGRYVVFYVPLDDVIDVVRVLHGARDIEAVFNPKQ